MAVGVVSLGRVQSVYINTCVRIKSQISPLQRLLVPPWESCPTGRYSTLYDASSNTSKKIMTETHMA